MHNMIQQILASGPVLIDGAWGTQFQLKGLLPGECPDAWNLTHPDRVEGVARSYVDAGSQVILTNTFGSSRVALDRYGLADRAAEINRKGAEISRRAAGKSCHVFASMGPTGRLLMMDEITEADLQKEFRDQALALTEGGAEGFVLETMSDLDEICVAIRVIKELGAPVVASMVFDSGKLLDRTMMGATPEVVAERLAEAGADVIGANCGLGPEQMLPICQRLHEASNLPIWIKPNAGLPKVVNGVAHYNTGPDEFAVVAQGIIDAGASFIGSCCGSNPEFISTLAVRVFHR